MSVYEKIGERIRRFREGEDLSQDQLAKKIGETANTVSRWETATYKPSLDDLEKLARALDRSVVDLFPEEHLPADQGVNALLRSMKALHHDDVSVLRSHAEFLRAERALKAAKQTRQRRKIKQ